MTQFQRLPFLLLISIFWHSQNFHITNIIHHSSILAKIHKLTQLFAFFSIIYLSLMAKGSKQKGSNHSIDEDVALCRAWIIISEDLIIGNSQSSGTMWNQIIAQFFQFILGAQDRIPRSLKSRRGNIQQLCTKFSECLDQVGRLNKSGQNEVDNVICFLIMTYVVLGCKMGVLWYRRRNHSSLIIVGLLSSMPLSGNRWM